MDTEQIKKFVCLIEDTDIEELQWESGDFKVALKRSELGTEKITQKKDSNNSDDKIKETKQEEKKLLSIKSPMVGTFYRAESPDRPPLVIEGNHVIPGQKVGIIEAMKIMKDVVSSVKGKIVKVLVEDGQPVEYGKELFLIDPENTEKTEIGR